MNTNNNEAIKRRRLGSPGVDDKPSSQDDAVSRLEQRMNLMEASFQREILEVKRAAAVELLATKSAIESRLSSLQDETDRLKAKVSQLQDEKCRMEAAFNLYVENSDWEYTAPDPPPDSYWAEQDYDYGDEDTTDDDYIYNINSEFFWRARLQSIDLRRGTFGLQYDREIYFGNPNDDTTRIRYDDALLPHWVEFRNSMTSWLFSTIRGTIERTQPFCVHFCNIELPANVLQALRQCFIPSEIGHVEELHLTRNDFQGSDGIEFALKIMKFQKKMIGFRYGRNPVDNRRDCQRLVDAIVTHPNISACYLEGLCGGVINGHGYLVNLLRKEKMKKVDFANCGVNTSGQSFLFDSIKSHPNLVWLCLDNNDLNDEDAIHIAGALQYNKTLETFSVLEGNKFTRLGVDILMKIVYDDSSLNAVADSNHVCAMTGMEFYSQSVFRGHYNVYRNKADRLRDKHDPKQSRARKIFHLLSQRNKQGTNAHHLEAEMGGDTLKVLPLALAAIQVYGQKAKGKLPDHSNLLGAAKLSIMYELVLSWNVTILDIHNN